MPVRVKIGFTGTRRDQTKIQRDILTQHFAEYRGVGELHHGCCVDSDEHAHKIARALEFRICAHPPDNPIHVAEWTIRDADFVYPAKPYLRRNGNIVGRTSMLFATPKGFEEVLRSGTWSTIRIARKQNKPITIIFPDGSVKQTIELRFHES